MGSHLEELKWTIFYIFLTLFITSIVIFSYKEWYWIWLLKKLNWVNYPVMVTNMLEGIWTYFRLSIYLGLYLALPSISLLILIYIGSGQYKYEQRSWIKWSILIGILNWWLWPQFCNLIGKTMWGQAESTLVNETSWFNYNLLGPSTVDGSVSSWKNSLLIMGKMSELLNSVIWIFSLFSILVFIIILLKKEIIRESYIENRGKILVLIYITVGMISPPDLILTVGVVLVIWLLLEFGVFLFNQHKVKWARPR